MSAPWRTDHEHSLPPTFPSVQLPWGLKGDVIQQHLRPCAPDELRHGGVRTVRAGENRAAEYVLERKQTELFGVFIREGRSAERGWSAGKHGKRGEPEPRES